MIQETGMSEQRKFFLSKSRVLWGAGIVVLFVLIGYCLMRPTITPSFYYWKTTFKLSQKEREMLSSQKVEELYVRFFDVDWDAASGQALPVGMISMSDPVVRDNRIVPVVFITNKVFLNIEARNVKQLADRVWNQIQLIVDKHHLQIKEVQIDCDWSDKSRVSYFNFLHELDKHLQAKDVAMSATIRLHQIKFYGRTGIPPVDRGMLMFYNMGDLKDTLVENSIFNVDDASKYVASINDYPLALDVALPIFSWVVHSRGGKVVGLMNNVGELELIQKQWLRNVKPCQFDVDTPQYFRGSYFKTGDHLKVESMSASTALEAAKLLSANLTKSSRKVVIFRLDSLTISQYEKEDIQALIDCFR